MSTRKLNVLVYTGTGASAESIRHCLLTLRHLLYPNYAVIPITEAVLLKEPWTSTCALFVMPGGADLGYCRTLNGAGNRIIAQYVRSGGRYLGFCAGGYYGSNRCEFEIGNKSLEVIGGRELAFFPGTCRGGAYAGFEYQSEKGARAAKLAIHKSAFPSPREVPESAYSYCNGGGVFVDAQKLGEKGVEILASYDDPIDVDGGSGKAAVVYCKVGQGAALLTGPHPEFEPANLRSQPDVPGYVEVVKALKQDDEVRGRVRFLRACLTKLGLEVSSGNARLPRPTTLHLAALYPDEAHELLDSWDEIISREGNDKLIKAEGEVFKILRPSSSLPVQKEGESRSAQRRLTAQVLKDITEKALGDDVLKALVERVAYGHASSTEVDSFASHLRLVKNSHANTSHARKISLPIRTRKISQETNGGEATEPFAKAASNGNSSKAVNGSKGVEKRAEPPAARPQSFQDMLFDICEACRNVALGADGTQLLDLEPDLSWDDWSELIDMLDTGWVVEDQFGGKSNTESADGGKEAKRLIIYDGPYPPQVSTFNYQRFYDSLKHYRDHQDPDAEEWGNLLMYGKVVTSTNTLLEKNAKLLSKLPTGFTLTARTQIAGRGRGSNVWVSPDGQLIFSTVINHPHKYAMSRPIVFIQYLAAVAIVEAIKTYDPGYEDLPIKLKWPNDIYARDPSKPVTSSSPPSYIKIGGILSQCAFSGGNYQVVLGIGLNATNARPTTSLDALVRELWGNGRNLPGFSLERLLARILTRLESLYGLFCRQGFTRELEQRYYRHWLHTDQVVTLEAEAGARAKVVGITNDWGMLKVAELDSQDRPTGRVWKLQSDENSFDYWKGLVRTKT